LNGSPEKYVMPTILMTKVTTSVNFHIVFKSSVCGDKNLTSLYKGSILKRAVSAFSKSEK
jgi:hypothetical protein